MVQITPQTRGLVATEPTDSRRGTDCLAQQCLVALRSDPFKEKVFVVCNRCRRAVELLVYDGQGSSPFQKRLSTGRLRRWPQSGDALSKLQSRELQVQFRPSNRRLAYQSA